MTEELGFCIPILAGFRRIPLAVFQIPKPRIIPQAKFSRNPNFPTWGDAWLLTAYAKLRR